MPSMEALCAQLDALQVEFYVQAVNRKLQAWAKQANLVDVKNELAQMREENVKLVQQISQLAQADHNGDADKEMWEAEQDRFQRIIATLEGEVTKAKTELERQAWELEAKKERTSTSDILIGRVKQAKSVLCLEERLERTSRDAELARYRTVAEETQKWESHEAYQRIKELEGEAVTLCASARATKDWDSWPWTGDTW